MPSIDHTAASSSTSSPRIAAARRRAAAARRGLAVAAVAAFGGALVLVRASHPATSHAPSAGLAAPRPLLREIRAAVLGGGSIASASGPSAVATATS